MPTWAFPAWEVESLHRPGSSWNAGTTHRLELCDCARCQERYAELSVPELSGPDDTGAA